MNKRVWSIAVALVMLLSIVCSAFVVSAADESVSEGDALDATVQLNNSASEQPTLLDTEGNPEPTSLVMSGATQLLPGQVFEVSVSLENYNGDWAFFVGALTYDPSVLEYIAYTSALDEDNYTLSVEESTERTLSVWMMSNSDSNLPADSDGSAALMNLQFKAVGETDSAELSFTFEEDSVAGYVDTDGDDILDEPEFIELGTYTPASDFQTVIRSSQPYLTMQLVDENGNSIFDEAGNQDIEIKQGQKVKAIVHLNDYYPDEGWMMMTLDLQYNGNKFKYISSESKGNLIDPNNDPDAVVMLPADTGDPENPLSICFYNSSLDKMVLKDNASDADILELTLQATGAGNALQIGASFQQEGNYKYDAETDTEVPLTSGNDYIAEHEEGTAEIKVTQTVLPYLSVEENQTVARGETFTLKVNINDYVDPWSMMSILVELDKNAYELDEEREIVAFDGSATVVPVLSGNKLGITIFSEDGNDLKLDGGYTSGTVLEIPIKVKSEYERVGVPINVSFLKGGNLFGDEDAVYKEEAVTQTITIQGKPELAIRIDQINGETVSEGAATPTIKQGDEVTFVVSVKDFTSAWDVMTLKALFDSTVFDLVEVNDEPATDLKPFVVPDPESEFSEFIPEARNGKLLACWFNSGPLSMTSSNEDLMQFTLKVTQENLTGDQLSQSVSVEFLEDGNYANDNMLTGEDYTETPAEVEFTITKVASEVYVEISWGAMQFTYNFGTWEPNEHIWDGRGWTCLNAEGEAENYITVTNQGGVDVTASFEFSVDSENTDLVGLTHSFKKGEDTIESLTVAKAADGETYPSETVYFVLSGDLPDGAELSEDAENPTALGTIKVTIDMADS